MTVDLRHGNCLDILPTLPDCSVDSIVTDPPYELGFMGKKWDNSGIAYNVTLWQECLRVLKPGGHLLAFGGTRTYHRMAVAIEDAGFEIRDSIHWITGSGFPKSLNVSKAIDKMLGVERRVVGSRDVGPDMRGGNFENAEGRMVADITEPASNEAKRWDGWGSALKPSHEPIVVARKPLVGTVAGNVLQWGVGAINIDGTRVGTDSVTTHSRGASSSYAKRPGERTVEDSGRITPQNGAEFFDNPRAGRWPANIIFTHNHDCADICTEGCPVAELDGQSGIRKSNPLGVFATQKVDQPRDTVAAFAARKAGDGIFGYGDSGGASRFFTVTEWDAPFRYVAKPGKRERNAGLDGLEAKREADRIKDDGAGGDNPRNRSNTAKVNHHPTVKPLALMRWLVRLVTPPNGTVLEPFAGSGTTLVACHLENFNAIGIEMTDEYLPIIQGRIAWAEQQTTEESPQQELEL